MFFMVLSFFDDLIHFIAKILVVGQYFLWLIDFDVFRMNQMLRNTHRAKELSLFSTEKLDIFLWMLLASEIADFDLLLRLHVFEKVEGVLHYFAGLLVCSK